MISRNLQIRSQITRPLFTNVYSIGESAAERIQRAEMIGRVHSVFRNAINISTPDNTLVSVVRRDVGSGPINILTNLPANIDLTQADVEVNHPVTRIDSFLDIGRGRIIISIENARKYLSPKESYDKILPIHKIRDNIHGLKIVAIRHGRSQGLGQLIPLMQTGRLQEPNGRNINQFARTASRSISSLLEAVKKRNLLMAVESANNLVGLGVGLTPSGDDVLAGLMASLIIVARNLAYDADFVQRFNREIIARVSGRTTLLSQEYLTHAARGDINEHVAVLVEKVLTGKPKDVEITGKRVLAVGETSGTDAVLGILLGLQLSCKGRLR